MPNSLCDNSITRKIHHETVTPAPVSGVYMLCVWLSGSRVETPSGWPHGNITNERGQATLISGSVNRDNGRSYIRTHEHAKDERTTS